MFYNTPLQEVITLLGTSLHNRKHRQGTAACKAPTLANRTGKNYFNALKRFKENTKRKNSCEISIQM